jgi:energy-coupling factor transport system ATP-binding protein
VIMHKGTVYKQGDPEEIFSSPKELVELGLNVPEVIRFQMLYESKIGIEFPKKYLKLDQLTEAIAAQLKEGIRL